MKPLAKYLADRLVKAGLSDADVLTKGAGLVLPGWYRMRKSWDILALNGRQLVAAVELKSIGSSYAKNCNNRVEEALGPSADAHAALRYDMYDFNEPPAFAYAMILRMSEEMSKVPSETDGAQYPVDEAFAYGNLLSRFVETCARMVQERLYDAVWLACVDIDNNVVLEPSKLLSFESFIRRLEQKVELVKLFSP